MSMLGLHRLEGSLAESASELHLIFIVFNQMFASFCLALIGEFCFCLLIAVCYIKFVLWFLDLVHAIKTYLNDPNRGRIPFLGWHHQLPRRQRPRHIIPRGRAFFANRLQANNQNAAP